MTGGHGGSAVRVALGYALFAGVAMAFAALGMAVWLEMFPLVHSSTGAWIMAQVVRALDVGDYAAAATIGRVPNASYNVLYPWLVKVVSSTALATWVGRNPVVVAHVLSAAFLGLAFVPLFVLWRRVGGIPAGVTGAAALCFPPVVATAALVRYESLAIALVLLAGWAAWHAATSGKWWTWFVAGFLVGLTYNAREYLVGSALAGVGAAWLGAVVSPPVPGRTRWKQATTSLFLLIDGLIPGVVVLPVALGFWPQNGVVYLFSYAESGGAGPSRFSQSQLYDLPRLAVPYGLGLLGLLAAAIRFKGAKRLAVVVVIATVLPFALFPLSRQQSPQYYLLAKVLVLSGWAGLVAQIPWRSARAVVALALLAATVPWMLRQVPPIARGEQSPGFPWHSEAWPAKPGAPAEVVDWANRTGEKHPLVVVTSHIENLDALFTIRHHRPVASLYDPNWRTQLSQVALIYDGLDLFVLTVSSEHQVVRPPPEASVVERHRAPDLLATIYRVKGVKQPPNWRHPGYPCIDFRGACLQRDWLEGGEAAVRKTTLHPGAEYPGGPGPGRIR